MNNDRLTSTIRDTEAALNGLDITDIIRAEDARLAHLANELTRVVRLVQSEIWSRERDARDAYNLDPTDGNDGERATARNIKRRWMDAA